MIAMIGMFAFLQVYAFKRYCPTLIRHFATTEVEVGLAVGMTVMAVALVSPFMGMLSDAIGRKVFIGGLSVVACHTNGIDGHDRKHQSSKVVAIFTGALCAWHHGRYHRLCQRGVWLMMWRNVKSLER
ncbi:Uncharacterised protein [Moraxella ovis]|nr:Uncharacterised protein [Moraxella ovis]